MENKKELKVKESQAEQRRVVADLSRKRNVLADPLFLYN